MFKHKDIEETDHYQKALRKDLEEHHIWNGGKLEDDGGGNGRGRRGRDKIDVHVHVHNDGGNGKDSTDELDEKGMGRERRLTKSAGIASLALLFELIWDAKSTEDFIQLTHNNALSLNLLHTATMTTDMQMAGILLGLAVVFGVPAYIGSRRDSD